MHTWRRDDGLRFLAVRGVRGGWGLFLPFWSFYQPYKFTGLYTPVFILFYFYLLFIYINPPNPISI